MSPFSYVCFRSKNCPVGLSKCEGVLVDVDVDSGWVVDEVVVVAVDDGTVVFSVEVAVVVVAVDGGVAVFSVETESSDGSEDRLKLPGAEVREPTVSHPVEAAENTSAAAANRIFLKCFMCFPPIKVKSLHAPAWFDGYHCKVPLR